MTDTSRTLLLMRHSEATHGGGSDHARTLTSRGRDDSSAAGRWLAEHVGALDLAVVSSATRTRQTWEAATEGGAQAASVDLSDEVYDAGLDELLALLTHLPDEARTVLVLGHAPGIPALANTIASEDGPRDMAEALDRGFPTTTLCRFEVEGDWLDVGAATADLVDVVVRQD